VLSCLIAACLIAVVCLSLSAIYDSDRSESAVVAQPPVSSPGGKVGTDAHRAVLKVMTLNLAHGRKHKAAHFFKRAATVERNLDDVAAVLRRETPHIVAVQEADRPSVWSGSFDHVSYLAGAAGYAFSIHGEHVDGPGLSYGTALLSRSRIDNALSVAFKASWPTFTKGFVAGTVYVGQGAAGAVDVISVHLDFSRESVRGDQLNEMAQRLSSRGRPLIVMGDFNCDWDDGGAMLAAFAKKLGLKTDRPMAAGLETHSLLEKRIDWILLSRELEIVSYRRLPDLLSDHRAVIAEVAIPIDGL